MAATIITSQARRVPLSVLIDAASTGTLGTKAFNPLDSQALTTRPVAYVPGLRVDPDISVFDAAKRASGVAGLGSLDSWFSSIVRKVAPIAAPIVGIVNPVAGAALSVATNTLFPTNDPAPVVAPAAQAPVQTLAPQPQQQAKSGVPGWVLPVGIVAALAVGVAVVAKNKR